jgi:membrane protease YdiL (CAAX protease family)
MTTFASNAPTSAPMDVHRTSTRVIAWIATMALSGLPQILLVETTGMDPQPMRWIWLAMAALFLLLTHSGWEPAAPLRAYSIVMSGVVIVTFFLVGLITGWLIPTVDTGVTAAAYYRIVLGVLAVISALALIGLFGNARSALVALGDMRSPVFGKADREKKRLNWTLAGPSIIVLFAGGFAFQVWTAGGFPPGSLDRILGLAPYVVTAALLNALWEEVLFRAGPLAALHRVVGPGQAILMTSLWFGFGHYYGSVPEGFAGVIQAGLIALLLGKAMLDTRGIGWPLAIHFSIDLVVFATIAAAVA